MPETPDQYIAHGGTHCPYCGSEEIVGGSIEIDAETAMQSITCMVCGKEWDDIYTLSTYEPFEPPS